MFVDKIQQVAAKNNSFLCVGLDPMLENFPDSIKKKNDAIFCFNKQVIDVTHDVVCAYKPQIAHYHALSAENELKRTIDYIHEKYPDIPVILDAKRGDIGSTAKQYALEAFERYKADAVTVNPFMGADTVMPFTEYKNKGVIILCRTSNPSAAGLQDLVSDNKKLYEIIAQKASQEWNHNNNVLMVVGATNPQELKNIRNIVGDMTLLLPGVGAQGGDIKSAVSYGLNKHKTGIIINSSRGILYAHSSGRDAFPQSARLAAILLRDQINKAVSEAF